MHKKEACIAIACHTTIIAHSFYYELLYYFKLSQKQIVMRKVLLVLSLIALVSCNQKAPKSVNCEIIQKGEWANNFGESLDKDSLVKISTIVRVWDKDYKHTSYPYWGQIFLKYGQPGNLDSEKKAYMLAQKAFPNCGDTVWKAW